jgi:hypothetical protein
LKKIKAYDAPTLIAFRHSRPYSYLDFPEISIWFGHTISWAFRGVFECSVAAFRAEDSLRASEMGMCRVFFLPQSRKLRGLAGLVFLRFCYFSESGFLLV